MDYPGNRAPIFVIGAGRSGTTVLSRIIERSPRVFNGYEFRYIWSYRAPFRDIDKRPEQCGDPRTTQYIRQFFSNLSSRYERVIIDKTPSNAWRIPFIRSVFPEAKFIHVVRDGRANVASRYREWVGLKPGPTKRYKGDVKQSGTTSRLELLRKRVKLFQARYQIGAYPARRLPAVFLDNVWPTFSQIVLKKPIRFGERTPGLKAIHAQCGVLMASACQWRDSVSEAAVRGRELPHDMYLEVKFESLITNHQAEIRRIFDFLDLAGCDAAVDYAKNNLKSRVATSWKSAMQQNELQEIRPVIEPTMSYLGYAWD